MSSIQYYFLKLFGFRCKSVQWHLCKIACRNIKSVGSLSFDILGNWMSAPSCLCPEVERNNVSFIWIRFSKSLHAFEKFVAHVDGQIDQADEGKPQIDMRQQCVIFLKYLGSQDTLKDIGVLFGLAESSVHGIIRRILTAVVPSLSADLIKWPTLDEAQRTAASFSTKFGFPAQVFGAIDSRENPIHPPSDDPSSYYNRTVLRFRRS
jgi:hypothetical protein